MNQRYVQTAAVSQAIGTGYGIEFRDLKTILDTLCGEGEEIVVHSAKVRLALYTVLALGSAPACSIQPVFVVSDANIADGAAAGVKDIDEILDAMTTGNFEFKFLNEPLILTPKAIAEAGSNILFSAFSNIDLTVSLRKAAQRLHRSPVLATNPELSVSLAIESAGAMTLYGHGVITIDYTVRPRTSRMI